MDSFSRYFRDTTLTGFTTFFFLPLALPFLPPLHSTVVDQPAWV